MNYSITARKRDNGIIFLRKIVKGAADESYGIEVANLAKLPKEVIKRSREVLEKVTSESSIPRDAVIKTDTSFTIDDYIEKDVIKKIRMTDTDTLTPIDALNLVYELKKTLG